MIQRNQVTKLRRVVGNLEPLTFALKDNAGAVVNLTGRSVTCRVIALADGAVKLAAGACTLTDAATGEGYYQPVTADMNTAGRYAVYFQDDATPARRWPYDGATYELELLAENKR